MKPGKLIAAGAALIATLAIPTGALAATDWTAPVDAYCERVATAFWAEPLNAVTNLGFVIAAAIMLQRQRRAAQADRGLVVLSLIAASIGIGSFLFHTLANRWTLIADIVPIAVFIHAFFFVAVKRFLGVGTLVAGLATLALLLLSPALELALRPILGGSASYGPGLVATFGIAAAVPTFGRGPAPTMLIAAGTAFSVALLFRVLDTPICDSFPLGTHFLWHSFNALAVGFALLGMERQSAAPAYAGRIGLAPEAAT